MKITGMFEPVNYIIIFYPVNRYLFLVVVVDGQGGIFALDVGHIVGPLNYSRCDTKQLVLKVKYRR